MKIKKMVLSGLLGVALVVAGSTSSAFANGTSHYDDTNTGAGGSGGSTSGGTTGGGGTHPYKETTN
ncbi:hypothetical protein [Cytobacillus sp. IB215665]|uniref:hypothetical protein n=1 Tax=Cytobacillus sp. IB215665 TaxID=3097357 RepID=UPI002A0CBBAE|nr:hypothetical protein [Cytobacillus sp. IB215665]MDX8365494.1 hypothetical protein [Cytobacillus sp. IB215665]